MMKKGFMNVLLILLCGRLVWNVKEDDFRFEFGVVQMSIVTWQSGCCSGADGNVC